MPDIVETELQISLQLEALVREWRDAEVALEPRRNLSMAERQRSWQEAGRASERLAVAKAALLAFAKANL